MADGLVTDEALLVALQVLPTVSIFGTQLVSARVHHQANEASTRAGALEQQIQQVLARDRAGADRELGELAEEHEQTLMRRPWGWDATTLNIIVLALVTVQVVVILQLAEPDPAGGWVRRRLMDLDPTLWAVVGIGLVQVAIVVVGAFDIRRVRRVMRARREVNLWGKTATIALLVSDEPSNEQRVLGRPVVERQTFERKLAHAVELADEVVREQRDTAWPLRLRARVRLTAAQRGRDRLPQAGRAASDLEALHQLRKRVRPEELLLEADAYAILQDTLRALAAVNRGLRIDSRDIRLWLRRGRLREQLAKTYKEDDDVRRQVVIQRALRAYQVAANCDRQSERPLVDRARLHLMLRKDPDEARSDAEAALAIAPEDPEATELWRTAVRAQAKRLVEQGQAAEALDGLRKAGIRRPIPGQAQNALQLVVPRPVLLTTSGKAKLTLGNRLHLLGKVATIAWESVRWKQAREREMAREFGKYLKARREELGLSHEIVASNLGVTSRVIEQYEQGKRRPPSKTVTDLAQLLHVPPTTLLVLSGELPPAGPAAPAPTGAPEPPADSPIAAETSGEFLGKLF